MQQNKNYIKPFFFKTSTGEPIINPLPPIAAELANGFINPPASTYPPFQDGSGLEWLAFAAVGGETPTATTESMSSDDAPTNVFNGFQYLALSERRILEPAEVSWKKLNENEVNWQDPEDIARMYYRFMRFFPNHPLTPYQMGFLLACEATARKKFFEGCTIKFNVNRHRDLFMNK